MHFSGNLLGLAARVFFARMCAFSMCAHMSLRAHRRRAFASWASFQTWNPTMGFDCLASFKVSVASWCRIVHLAATCPQTCHHEAILTNYADKACEAIKAIVGFQAWKLRAHMRAHTGGAAIPAHMRAKNTRAADPSKLPPNCRILHHKVSNNRNIVYCIYNRIMLPKLAKQ